ncbi:MAG TPA: hypothetical protein PLS63_07590 [Microthrixaceae bacterium]|nr:hypothetical protein [Microthrixaceae bacterium]
MIRTYWLLIVAVVLVAAGAALAYPPAGPIVLGVGAGFIWWDRGDEQ